MKIEGYNLIKTLEGRISGIPKSQNSSRVNKSGINDEVVISDNVDLSCKAIEFNKIKSAIKDIPEIRQEKVKGLADQVRSGKYDVRADLIEPKLLREHIMDALLLSPPVIRNIYGVNGVPEN